LNEIVISLKTKIIKNKIGNEMICFFINGFLALVLFFSSKKTVFLKLNHKIKE